MADLQTNPDGMTIKIEPVLDSSSDRMKPIAMAGGVREPRVTTLLGLAATRPLVSLDEPRFEPLAEQIPVDDGPRNGAEPANRDTHRSVCKAPCGSRRYVETAKRKDISTWFACLF